jgi:hypothetical protein
MSIFLTKICDSFRNCKLVRLPFFAVPEILRKVPELGGNWQHRTESGTVRHPSAAAAS